MVWKIGVHLGDIIVVKKIISIALLVVLAMSLAACSNSTNTKTENKEGVYPYELSEREENILQAFGMGGNSQILSFRAPSEAISLEVNVYMLDENGEWKGYSGGGISIGTEREPFEVLTGMFTIQLHKDYSIDFNISTGGRASYTTESVTSVPEVMASTKAFLTDFKEIEINKEIPVALMVYDSGTSMRSITPETYFEPALLSDMDFVQAVTLTFSDK